MLGETNVFDIPDAQARLGIIGTTNYSSLCASCFAAIAPALALYPAPSPAATEIGGGTDQDSVVGYEPGNENYLNTRWDYTLGAKDNLFARYVYDNGTMTNPFADRLGLYPNRPRHQSVSDHWRTASGQLHLAQRCPRQLCAHECVRLHIGQQSCLSLFPRREPAKRLPHYSRAELSRARCFHPGF